MESIKIIKSIYVLSLVLACIHLFICFLVLVAPMGFFVILTLDAPLMPLVWKSEKTITYLIVFGVFGTALWFIIPILIDKILKLFFKNVKGILEITIILAVIFGILRIFYSLSVFFQDKMLGYGSMPKELRVTGVKKGEDLISETIFFEDTKLVNGLIAIVQADLDPNLGLEIGIAGSDGAVILDKYANIKSSITSFGYNAQNVNIMDVDRDGKCEYLIRRGFDYTELINHQGKFLWTSKCDEAFASDFNSDGMLEILISNKNLDTNDNRVFVLLDRDGHQ